MASKFAIISVYDKTGIVELGAFLEKMDFGIIATGTTYKTLREGGVNAIEVSEYTGFPEMFEGRVKTLHPKIHAGILAKSCQEHMDELAEMEISSIDIVVCNMYPFREARKREGITDEELIEMIDIGGPTLARAAAKNHERVVAVCDPDDYGWIMKEMEALEGKISRSSRHQLASKAFRKIALYDFCISEYFQESSGMDATEKGAFLAAYEKVEALKYGENPQQEGFLYRRLDKPQIFPDMVETLGGGPPGFCNYLDMDAAIGIMREFMPEKPFAVVIKHANPIGASFGETALEAFKRARGVDEMSAFGGIIGITGKVDIELANAIKEIMFSVLVAEAYDPDAVELLRKRKNRILMKLKSGWRNVDPPPREIKMLRTAILIQDWDEAFLPMDAYTVASKRKPTPQESEDLYFAWRVVKHVKSNAILLAKGGQTIGTGAGQMSRIDSFRIAIEKAGENTKGAVAASDAFFPFEDNIEVAHKAGITALIQPGGSLRDKEVIQKCDEFGMAMVITGKRHFRH